MEEPDHFVKTKSSQVKKRPNQEKKKSPKACVACRKKKAKCDGHSPCDRCIKAQLDCNFIETEKTSRKVSLNHKARLKRLKDMLVQLSTLIDHTPRLFLNQPENHRGTVNKSRLTNNNICHSQDGL